MFITCGNSEIIMSSILCVLKFISKANISCWYNMQSCNVLKIDKVCHITKTSNLLLKYKYIQCRRCYYFHRKIFVVFSKTCGFDLRIFVRISASKYIFF